MFFEILLFENLFGAKNQLCAKGYPNRIPNGREKLLQTNKQTHRHFCIYISRDNDYTILSSRLDFFLRLSPHTSAGRAMPIAVKA